MHQLEYFIAVVKYKNFTKAANECHISQPAISQQIKELENALGVKLLNRKGRGFTVTQAGLYLYQHGQDLLQTYQKLIQHTQELGQAASQQYVLNLGYLRDFGTREFLQAVTDFSKAYPQVKVKIHSGSHEDLFHLIESDQVDLNFSDLRRAPSDRYVNDHLAQSRFEAVMSKQLLPDKQERINVHELAEIPCILIVGNSQQNSEIEYYRDMLGIESEFSIVGTYQEALVQAAAGQGYFLTNEHNGDTINDPALKKLILMSGKQALMQQYYAFWKADNSGFYVETFAQMLKEQFAK
jgi:DNA-binding transcriptional LysR family regulator